MPESALAPPQHSTLNTVKWAVYLACSWTWCIGMFLPVLLVRDYHFWGWVVFAVPNVIGAAAVGFFQYRQPEGGSFLDRHRPAMLWFSGITILFHVFFAGWMIRRLMGQWGLALPFAAAALFYGLAGRKGGGVRGAIIALAVSAVAALVWFFHPAAMPVSVPLTPLRLRDLAFLAPGIAFGFLLAPHLDLTLQRARLANSPAVAKQVFVLGFGLFFLILITFSLFYATPAAWLVAVDGANPTVAILRVLCLVLGVHMSIQSAYTVALHLREMPVHRALVTRPYEMTAGLVITAVGLLLLSRPMPVWLGLDAGEVIYRIFLGFYGLVFPAYVWIAMIWHRHDRPGPSAATITVFAAAVIAALPFFAVGFLARQTMWILPGLLLVVAAPLALPRKQVL